MESYVRIGERGLKNLTYPYMGVRGGVQNCQNHAYVINEWPLIQTKIMLVVYCEELIYLYFPPSFHHTVENKGKLLQRKAYRTETTV